MLYMLITIIMHVHDPKISHFKVFLRKVDRYTLPVNDEITIKQARPVS